MRPHFLAMVNSFRRFVRSFGYAGSGFFQAVCLGRNLRFILCAGLTAIIWGLICQLNAAKWALLVLTVGTVVSAELLNTAIEAAVDLVTLEWHPLAKRAKDVAAAAVLVICITSLGAGLAIFGDQQSRGLILHHMQRYWYAWLSGFAIMAAFTFKESGADKIKHHHQ